MKRTSYVRVGLVVAFLVMMLFSVVAAPMLVLAQDPPAGETPTIEPTTPAPPTETPTSTPTVVDSTATPTPSPTGVIGTATATVTATAIATVTPVPGGPVPIPEPITVVLFGTGLAALSAAVASRRGKSGK